MSAESWAFWVNTAMTAMDMSLTPLLLLSVLLYHSRLAGRYVSLKDCMVGAGFNCALLVGVSLILTTAGVGPSYSVSTDSKYQEYVSKNIPKFNGTAFCNQGNLEYNGTYNLGVVKFGKEYGYS